LDFITLSETGLEIKEIESALPVTFTSFCVVSPCGTKTALTWQDMDSRSLKLHLFIWIWGVRKAHTCKSVASDLISIVLLPLEAELQGFVIKIRSLEK